MHMAMIMEDDGYRHFFHVVLVVVASNFIYVVVHDMSFGEEFGTLGSCVN